MGIFFLPTVNGYQYLTSLKVCDWSGRIFGASASARSLTKKMAMSPSSTVHGGQHDTKYVTFEFLRPFLRGDFLFEVTNRAFYAFKLAIAPQREEIEPALLGMSLTIRGEVPRSFSRFSIVAVATISD